MQTNTLYLIDAHAFLHRCFHALPGLTTPDGEEVGALYGFVKLLVRILQNDQPEFVAVCFDSRGGSKFRKELYPQYKANRPPIDPALLKQLGTARDATLALGLCPVFLDGWEADDIMATIARRSRSAGVRTVIVSGDKDICQLINDDIVAWDGSSPDLRDEKYVLKRYGIPPSVFADYLALLGDASDNVPGVVGIGEKSATKILQKYGSLAKALVAAEDPVLLAGDRLLQKLARDSENARMSRNLVLLDKDAPVTQSLDDFRPIGYETQEFKNFSSKYMFKILESLYSPENNGLKAIKEIPFAELLPKITDKIYISEEDSLLALLLDDEVAFLPNPSEEEKQSILKILADNSIRKNVFSLKSILYLLNVPGNIGISNFFDLQAAERMLYFQAKPRTLSDLACLVYSFVPKSDRREKIFQGISCFEDLCGKLYKKIQETGQEHLLEKTELPLIPIVYGMEKAGIAVDREKLKAISDKYAARIVELQAEANEMAGGEINLNSPRQLSVVLYDKFKIELTPEWRRQNKNKDGYSTSEEALLPLKDAHPLIPVILEFREISKLKSTFADPLYAASADDGRVHTVFDQLGTATGRFSSSRPNLQNIPAKSVAGQEIRECFIAPGGYVLLSADYSQIDLRVLAHLSGDNNFTDAFRHGEDIHLRTASEIFNSIPEMVTKEMRRSAKAINFGIVYGQTPQGLSQQLGISRAAASKYIRHYFEACPGIKAWMDKTIADAKINGYVSTFAGRRRMLPELASPNRNIRLFGERAAGNMPVQGGSAEIIKKAMLDTYKAFEGIKGITMLLQVHDELIFEVRKDLLAEAAKTVKEKMENAYILAVPLAVELKAGQNWKDMKNFQLAVSN